MADYGRDTNIGRPDDALDIKKASIALQAIADLTVDSEALGEPESSQS
jgi:hypothetical protein